MAIIKCDLKRVVSHWVYCRNDHITFADLQNFLTRSVPFDFSLLRMHTEKLKGQSKLLLVSEDQLHFSRCFLNLD